MSGTRLTIKAIILAASIIACGAASAATKSQLAPQVQNMHMTLSYRQGWIVDRVRALPGMTLKAGDHLQKINGLQPDQLGPLVLTYLLNQTFDSPMKAEVLRGGHRTSVSIFRGDEVTPAEKPVEVKASKSITAPNFDLISAQNGHHIKLRSFRGRWVLLNFWGTYCAPCKIEAPVLARLAHDEAKRLVVLGIDLHDEPGVLDAFLAQNPRSFPILRGGSMKDPLAVEYGISSPTGGGSVPVSILIAPNGRITYVQGGFWDPPPLETIVHSYLDRS